MAEEFTQLKDIFERTQSGVQDFMNIIQPVIDNAQNEHDRLYFHHIFEEEDHRLDRLNELLPQIKRLTENGAEAVDQRAFIQLLQDISLEKFGLHNFLEHLDLSLFEFKDTEHQEKLEALRTMTHNDYQAIKDILQHLNERFGAETSQASVPTDEKENASESVKVRQYADSPKNEADAPPAAAEPAAANPGTRPPTPSGGHQPRKQLTVGSLKQ